MFLNGLPIYTGLLFDSNVGNVPRTSPKINPRIVQSAGDHLVPYERFVNTSGGPLTVSDTISIVNTKDYPGYEGAVSINRPFVSSETSQSSQYVMNYYKVIWQYNGTGIPASQTIINFGKASASIDYGTTSSTSNMGGNFGLGAVSGAVSVSVTTDGHTGPYSVLNTSSSSEIAQTNGDVTSDSELHPVVGLTAPGGYSGSAEITWNAYENSPPPGAGAHYIRKSGRILTASSKR